MRTEPACLGGGEVSPSAPRIRPPAKGAARLEVEVAESECLKQFLKGKSRSWMYMRVLIGIVMDK